MQKLEAFLSLFRPLKIIIAFLLDSQSISGEAGTGGTVTSLHQRHSEVPENMEYQSLSLQTLEFVNLLKRSAFPVVSFKTTATTTTSKTCRLFLPHLDDQETEAQREMVEARLDLPVAGGSAGA